MVRLFSIGIFVLLCCSSTVLLSQQLAFPGAEGYGKYASGGRGGRIVEVTSLEDLDRYSQVEEGTLRAALQTEGEDPITIVFRVSGLIELDADIKANRSNITIAGQTAPGDGICIKNRSIILSGENMIIRYVRFRPGDELRGEPTGLNIENSKNIMVDHCSFSWAIEENTAFYDNVNTTVQWCIISEGLYDSYDTKGARGYGGQWGGQYSSYHHNLFAHNNSRSPRINGSRSNDTIALVDFRNNVIFNWGSAGAVYGGESQIYAEDPDNPGENIGGNFTNMINNYYKPGPATASTLLFAAPSYEAIFNEAVGYGKWYFSGNYMEGVEGGMNEDNWEGVDVSRVGSADNIRSEEEFEVSPIETQTAQEAFELVLENAGALLPERDSVDARIVAETRGEVEVTGNGIIDSQSEVGGWPEYESLEPLADSDKDGMPDAWETENSLDPDDAEDGKLVAEGGYTNLEIYLNSITESQHEVEPTGIGDVITKDFHFYPNPSNDKIFFSSKESLKKVELYDMNGRALLSEKNMDPDQPNFLKIDHLGPGFYMLKVIFKDGMAVEHKVIKQ